MDRTTGGHHTRTARSDAAASETPSTERPADARTRTAGIGRRAWLAGVTGALAGLAGCNAGGLRTATTTADAPALAAADGTATFRAGLANRGYRPETTVPATVAVDWRVPGVNLGDHTAAKASVVRVPDGTYVVAGDTGEVTALTRDGRARWTAPTAPSARGIHGTPTVVDGVVYVGAYDGALYAFDLADGRRRWRQPLGDAIGSSPVYHDGIVYIAVEYDDPSGAVFGVEAATGRVVWRDHQPADHPHSTIAIDRSRGRLVVGDNDGVLHGWRYPDLGRAWTFATDGAIKGPIATHDGGAIFGSWDGRIYRVALADGTETWSVDVGNKVMGGAGIDPVTDTVYIGGHGGRLHALAAATGDHRWTFETDGIITGCPTVTGETILIGSYDRTLYALDRGGRERWRHRVDAGWVTCEPYLDDDGIVITARNGGDTSGPALRLTGT